MRAEFELRSAFVCLSVCLSPPVVISNMAAGRDPAEQQELILSD